MKAISNRQETIKTKGEKGMLMRASDISSSNQEQMQQVEVAKLASTLTSSKLAGSNQATRELPTMLKKGNVKMALVAPSTYWISYN